MIEQMAESGETAQLLRRVPLFAALEAESLRALASYSVPRRYEPGQVVFRENDEGDICYVIQTGAVRVTRKHHTGRVITLAELGPGSIFGELAMLSRRPRSATVEALGQTTALALFSDDLKRLLASQPQTALSLLESLADRLRTANERLAVRAFQTVQGRVAQALLSFPEVDGNLASDQVTIKTTQHSLAQLAGSSRESTSRFLATLARAGIVTPARGKIVVHDTDALRNYIY
jgi:CRP/FNR family transcriptional regulator, cyclic AMP receptor protein